ncbi:hypothetical protein [Aequorivita marina]|uniref:hypothetical protein n=1 Tax=Aequorivita marina TaxID=3073654 RepID=UPI002874B13A|nr:hypothetical protein [Aequorivita sp. S2608]MDS1298050.1 hypothetical protein [Aequorivita sp. S2608]
MQEYLKGNKKPIQQLMAQKMEKIKTHAGTVYSDTSHIFIKSFGWEIPKHIPQEEIGVIILKRAVDAVAKSTHRTQSGPFNALGRDWIIYPNGNNNIKPPLRVFEYEILRVLLKAWWKINKNSGVRKYPPYFKRQSIKLIKWYYKETYALGELYQKTFPEITYVEVSLEELNTVEGFEKIVQAFNLQEFYSKEKIKTMIGKPVNQKKVIA